jgi:hypothetical protein
VRLAWQDGRVKRNSFESAGHGRHRTPKEKARIFRAHGRSGLSLLAFARQHGLCYASLLRWRARRSTRPTPADRQADPRFVRVKIAGDGLGGDYLVSWPGGRTLKIPSQFEPEALRRLLGVLEERP